VTADLGNVVACNCSICQKRGALWTSVSPEHFALRAGSDDLRDYQFGRKVIHHLFCSVCGIKSFARGVRRDGTPTVAINTRCLDGIDIARLNVTTFDGKTH